MSKLILAALVTGQFLYASIAPINPDGNHGAVCGSLDHATAVTPPISMYGANFFWMDIATANNSTPAPSNISDTIDGEPSGNTWHVINPPGGCNLSGFCVSIAYSYFASAGPNQIFTFTGGFQSPTICVHGLSGVMFLSDPVDTGTAAASTDNAAENIPLPAYTPTGDGEVVVSAIGFFQIYPPGRTMSLSVLSLASQINADAVFNMGAGIGYQIQTTATAVSPVWSWTGQGNAYAAAAIVAFKPAPPPITYTGVNPSSVVVARGISAPNDTPPQAAAVGYNQRTFVSYLQPSTIDLAKKYPPAISGRTQWYFDRFFGNIPSSVATLGFNANGSLTLGANNGYVTIATAGLKDGGQTFVGTVFGGGMYMEALMAWDHSKVVAAMGDGLWPAFWAMAVEHLIGTTPVSDQWAGQTTGPPGYEHFLEIDAMEDDVWSFSPPGTYGGALHDWWGQYAITCGGYCSASNVPGGGSNFANFQIETGAPWEAFIAPHRYGVLWVPATNTTLGYLEYYWDGVKLSRTTYSKYTASSVSPPPGTAPWTFGVGDIEHFPMILQTGNFQPLTVHSVSVWQTNTANNIIH